MTTAAKPKRTAGDDHLPPEIWREVLARVPTKSIYRSRVVCKSWYSLVSCPNFISDHSSRNMNKKSNNVLLQLHDKKSDVWSFRSLDGSFTESDEHDYFPKAFLGLDLHIVGSCNGLICLSKYDVGEKYPWHHVRITFLIWNPSIRKIVELPSPTHNKYASYFSFGFGFDSKTSDYKVLYIIRDKCEIFDMRKGTWRAINPPGHRWDGGFHYSGCYLDGVVHWSLHQRYRWVLLSFDMSDECFREITLPDSEEFTTGVPWCVTFDGLIWVIVWKTGHGGSVWRMEDYGVSESWTKVSNIDYQRARGLSSAQIWADTFSLWGNGKVLMVQELSVNEADDSGTKQDLVLYDIKSRRCKRLITTSKDIWNLCLYEESLVWMSEMHNICAYGSNKSIYTKEKSNK